MSDEIYTKCPVTEAIFDVRITLPKDFSYTVFEEYYDDIKNEFPNKEVGVEFESSIAFKKDEDPIIDTKRGPIGFHFKSTDGKRIIQFKKNGFTFNKLKPYDNWEVFSGEAKKHFEKFIEICKPVSIDRLGLRYINRLEIPLPILDFQQYITTFPNISSGLPQVMADFFMRLVIPEKSEEPSNIAIITQTIDRKALIKDILPLIFDIDIYRIIKFGVEDKEKIYKFFEEFRNYKNRIFNESITEKTKSLIR